MKLLYGNLSYDYSKYGYTSSQEPIFAETSVAIGLCWLAGGSYIDLKNVYSCSVSSIYAVNSCDLLKLHFPMTLAEIHSSQSQFQEISSNSAISGCIGAMDGLFVFVKCPFMKDSNNNPFS